MHNNPRLYPWYVHLAGGWSVGSILPWYLSCSQFYCRGKKLVAALFMVLTLLLYTFFAVAGVTAEYSWDKLLLFFLVINMGWSCVAWLVQRKCFGPAPKRYYFREWKRWLSPLLIAMALGIGYSVCLSVFPIIGDRFEMYQSQDLLAKDVILWDFFKNIPFSFFFSIPLGLWWAGERTRFSIAHLFCFCFGLILFSIILSSISGLFYFLLNKGQFFTNQTSWMVLGHEPTGLQKTLLFFQENDYSVYVVAPLLVGAVVKARDFWKRSLTIFPLLCLSFFLLAFYSPQLWQFYQNQIFYDMSSPESSEQESAYKKAQVLLKRFPEHSVWPEIADKVARYYHDAQKYEKSEALYRMIAGKTQSSSRWHREAGLAAAALSSSSFYEHGVNHALKVPSLRYESYMTNNWMILIRTMRFYEATEISETDTLIKLKDVSTDDEKIKLKTMPTLAELVDNAENLGYDILLLPSDLLKIKELILAGFPVIQPIKHTFTLLSGVNSGRAVITGSTYANILDFLKQSDVEGVSYRTFFTTEKENQGDRHNRIDNLAYAELPFSFWGTAVQKDAAPFMAVVFPKDQKESLFALSGGQELSLRSGSKAHLAALIGLHGLKCGDPIAAITWAQRSYALSGDSFPLHIGHLATLFWKIRDKKIESRLELDKHFQHLTAVDTFFSDNGVSNFLAMAEERFGEDLDKKQLNWMIRKQYKDFLDRSDEKERNTLITLSKMEVAHYPHSRKDWLFLSSLYEWDDSTENMLVGYSGALSAGRWNNAMALKVAYLLIQNGKMNAAEELVSKIKAEKVRFLPDYYYCQASVAKWKKNYSKASKLYEKAIRMRRYDRNYHLDYAEMLQQQGDDSEKIEQLRNWASRLDVQRREVGKG